jgi:hypothetical protein
VVPYATATSGARAREEIMKLLAKFGCADVGFMDRFTDHSVILQFTHRGRTVQLRASASGWAQMFLKAHPWNRRTRKNRAAYEAKALSQGMIAINSILRDWVKGQITAVECGMMSFEAVFMPHMLAPDGRSVLEHMQERKMLPATQGAE